MLAILSCRIAGSHSLVSSLILPAIHQQIRGVRKYIKEQLDYSKYPELLEKDLEESFAFGSGPGGQHVNKTANCVSLKHLPTGIRVKCHEQRYRQMNQKIAREILREKVDELLNGENSIANQIKRIESELHKKSKARAAKKREQKENFKKLLLAEGQESKSVEESN